MKEERFKKPTDNQIIEFAIVFNEGKLEQEKLADMVGFCQMVIDRLYDNGHIAAKSKREIEIENPPMEFIDYNGYRYWFEWRLGKDDDICLATNNPREYCNGFYAYSSKDPGSGMAYVVTKTNNPKPDWNAINYPPTESN